jgi:hypothetical protein
VAAVIEIDCMPLGRTKQFFLKKEPKNFCSFGWSLSRKAEAKTDKSFLLLFFKKEDLSFALKFVFPSRQNTARSMGDVALTHPTDGR